MRYKRFEELPAWQDAVKLARETYRFAAAHPLRPNLRDQLERAALSVSNNIAEGFERGSTDQLLACLYIARGSAGEVRSILCVLEGMPRMAAGECAAEIARLKQSSESVSRQIFSWIESLKRLGLKGPRSFVTDSIRLRNRTDNAPEGGS